MSKKLPDFASDEEAEAFLEQDLSEYIVKENFTTLRFEFAAKTERVNMRLPKPLLDAVKHRAAAEKMPYQRFIRAVLEQAVAGKQPRQAAARQRKVARG